MKFIEKAQEPIDFLGWKQNNVIGQQNQPSWEDLDLHVKHNIRTSLMREQGYICCYCENALLEGDCHIEHLQPRVASPGMVFDYENLLCSCQGNLKKGEPIHCGHSKGSGELLISPLDPTCEERFSYTVDGHINPSLGSDLYASSTIDTLKLDIDILVDFRQKAIEPCISEDLSPEEKDEFVKGYLLEKENNNGNYNEFYTVIKYLSEIGDI